MRVVMKSKFSFCEEYFNNLLVKMLNNSLLKKNRFKVGISEAPVTADRFNYCGYHKTGLILKNKNRLKILTKFDFGLNFCTYENIPIFKPHL